MCRKKEVSKDPRPDTPVFPAAELAAPAYGYYTGSRNNPPQQQQPVRRRQQARINQQARQRNPYYNQYYKN